MGEAYAAIAPAVRASARMRYTDATPIPRSDAIASRVRPAFASRSSSAALARVVGARPLYLPSTAALAIPSRCRSSITPAFEQGARLQAGYCFPSLRGKSCFFLEFPTCRLLEVGVLRVNGASRQFEKEFADRMAVLSDQNQGSGARYRHHVNPICGRPPVSRSSAWYMRQTLVLNSVAELLPVPSDNKTMRFILQRL
jgi:hypothetical protein